MAQVSYVHLHGEDEDDRDDVVVSLDSAPYWSNDFDVYTSDLDFPTTDFPLRYRISTVRQQRTNRPRTQVLNDDFSDTDSITNVDLFDRENQVNFVMDLFHQRVEQSSSRILVENDLACSDPNFVLNFGDIERNEEMGSNNLELDQNLGLGFSLDDHDNDDNSGFMVADCGDEFFVSRRGAVSESGESSTASGGPDIFMGGLRVVDIGSDSEAGENEVVVGDDYGLDNGCDDDASLRLCWDAFQLEDDNRGDGNEDFDWEEVDGRIDEREVLSMFFDAEADDDASVLPVIPSGEELGDERVDALEWEVLLNAHNLEVIVNPELGHDGEHYDEDNYAEYEMFFGQFAENENASMGRPPASKRVIENLLSVVMTREDLENNNALCAVCKDDINVGELSKQLPCAHRYHGDCIVPWLGIRNTCPVCRYELPTDDSDYERRRMERAGQAQ